MKIVFSKHAKKRLRERDISRKDIQKVLLKPDWYEPTYKERIRVQKRIKQKTLEVIYAEEKNTMVVITCYYL